VHVLVGERGGSVSEVTLFNDDCLNVLRGMSDGAVDVVVTDPPYPNLKGGLKHMVGGVAPRTQETITVGTPWGNELEALREFPRIARYGAIVFCSWHSIGEVRALCGGEAVGLVTWYKRNSQPSFRNRPHYQCEYAWLIEYATGMNWKPIKTFYDIAGLPAGCFASERVTDGTGKAAHPTQKPLEIMGAMLNACPKGAKVLDPFLGSGTTGVASVEMGFDFVGVELNPAYFAMAQKRIAAAQSQGIFDLEVSP
jgi:site-specific DNA-methyltransferase (adenine-specific)